MTRNEKTSSRVAKIAARIMASPAYPGDMVVNYLKSNSKGGVSDPLYWRDVRALAASCLTQAPNKYDDMGFDPRDGSDGKPKKQRLPDWPSGKSLGKRASSPMYPAAKPKRSSP